MTASFLIAILFAGGVDFWLRGSSGNESILAACVLFTILALGGLVKLKPQAVSPLVISVAEFMRELTVLLTQIRQNGLIQAEAMKDQLRSPLVKQALELKVKGYDPQALFSIIHAEKEKVLFVIQQRGLGLSSMKDHFLNAGVITAVWCAYRLDGKVYLIPLCLGLLVAAVFEIFVVRAEQAKNALLLKDWRIMESAAHAIAEGKHPDVLVAELGSWTSPEEA